MHSQPYLVCFVIKERGWNRVTGPRARVGRRSTRRVFAAYCITPFITEDLPTAPRRYPEVSSPISSPPSPQPHPVLLSPRFCAPAVGLRSLANPRFSARGHVLAELPSRAPQPSPAQRRRWAARALESCAKSIRTSLASLVGLSDCASSGAVFGAEAWLRAAERRESSGRLWFRLPGCFRRP